jgi:hypothetical protein
MSQFYQGVTAGSLPPSVPTSFVTDSGTAIPVANILNVVTPGGGTQGVATSASGNTITITVSPTDITGTITTVGAVTGNVITIALGSTPGTYTFDCKIVGFNSSTPSGAGYTIVGAVRTDGATATLLSGQAVDSFEEAATAACTGTLTVSANNAIFQVLGAAGLTINWKASVQYIFVG